jgi:uncharacterized protein YndB with AHSA1/START domain
MKKIIKHTFDFKQPAKEVWKYLTEAELMAEWLMKTDFKPIVGHQFRFWANAVCEINFDGNIYCEVLEIVPQKKLVYSWKSGATDGSINFDSIVTWTLNPKGKGTELVLEHTGFNSPVHDMLFQAMNKGWETNVIKIINTLNTTA